MFCGKCGATVEPGVKFCGSCGEVMEVVSNSASPQNVGAYQTAAPAETATKTNYKLIGIIACAIALLVVVIGLGSLFSGGSSSNKGSGSYKSSQQCYMCNKSPAKKFVTANGTTQFYCKDHVTRCFICDKKATKKYTNLLDFTVFVCKEHYKDAQS